MLGWVTTVALVGWHRPVGWAALAIVAARVAWGFVGSGHARFASFVRGPRATLRYAALALRGDEPRYVGHNPLGAAMVIAIFAVVAALALTGWVYTTDRFWGDETVELWHRAFAWIIAVLALLHVAGVWVASVRHRENLVAAMLHGEKRAAARGDEG